MALGPTLGPLTGGGGMLLVGAAAGLGWRLAPREARLQLARRPLMIGEESSQAFLAASGSLKVTKP